MRIVYENDEPGPYYVPEMRDLDYEVGVIHPGVPFDVPQDVAERLLENPRFREYLQPTPGFVEAILEPLVANPEAAPTDVDGPAEAPADQPDPPTDSDGEHADHDQEDDQ